MEYKKLLSASELELIRKVTAVIDDPAACAGVTAALTVLIQQRNQAIYELAELVKQLSSSDGDDREEQNRTLYQEWEKHMRAKRGDTND